MKSNKSKTFRKKLRKSKIPTPKNQGNQRNQKKSMK